MPVTLALLSSKNSRFMANTLSWSRVPLPTSQVTSTPLWISCRAAQQTIEFRYLRPDVILSMQKRALIRCIALFLCRGWAQHIVDRWRDAVSPGSSPSPSASDDFDLLPCDISPDFLCRGAYVLKHLALFSFH